MSNSAIPAVMPLKGLKINYYSLKTTNIKGKEILQNTFPEVRAIFVLSTFPSVHCSPIALIQFIIFLY